MLAFRAFLQGGFVRSLLSILILALVPNLAMANPVTFESALETYRARSEMNNHISAWQDFVALANEKHDDEQAQLWCARTSFFLAHRQIQNRRKSDGAKTAKLGIECALRLAKTKPYDGRYWELMNRYKAAATMHLVKAFKAAKPMKESLEQLIEMDPSRHEGYVFLAMAYRELPSGLSWGDNRKALEYAQKGQKRAPKDPEALLELAECLKANGQKVEAKSYYEAVLNKSVSPRDLEWETNDARRWAKRQMKSL